MDVRGVDVHDLREPDKDWVLIVINWCTGINDVRDSSYIVVGPGVGLLVLIYHKDSFELRAILMEIMERQLDWAVIAVVYFHFLFILLVGEAKWFMTEFAVHENTR